MNKFISGIIFSAVLFFGWSAFSQLPSQPTETDHPGSSFYEFQSKQEKIQISGRAVDVFLPAASEQPGRKFPVIVFGHGQAIGVDGYEQSFQHLAKKGIIVIHPTYDTGFFDQDWRRMADDFNGMAAKVIQKYSDIIDQSKIVYSGHSKGGYVALVAAGAPSLNSSGIKLSAMVFFAPAGFDADYLKNLDPQTPLTLVWSDADTIIKQSAITSIYSQAPSLKKQWIEVKSYPSLKADHFFPLNKSYFFGGQNGISPYHFFTFWKFLGAAALGRDAYIYGSETATTGVVGLENQVTKNFN